MQVKFRSGDIADLPADHSVSSSEYKLPRTLSGRRSALERRPFLEIKFRADAAGPYCATRQFGARSKDYPAMMGSIYERWDDDCRKTTAADMLEVVAAKGSVANVRNKKKQQLENARAKPLVRRRSSGPI